MFVLMGLIFVGSMHIIRPETKSLLRTLMYAPILLIVATSFRKYVSRKPTWSTLILVAHASIYFLAAVAGRNLWQGVSGFVNGPLLMLLLILSLIIYYRDKGPRNLLLNGLFFSMVLSLTSVAIIFGLLNVNYYSYQDNELIGASGEAAFSRVTGVYANPNTLGILFSLQVALLCFYLKISDGKLIRLISTVLLAATVLGVLATASRASILMALLVISAYIVTATSLKTKMYFFAVLAGFGALSILLNDYTFLVQRLSSSALTGRDEVWRKAFFIVSQNVYFGLGPGQSNFRGPDGFVVSAHNYYIQLAVESGVIATGIFIIFLIYILIVSFKKIVIAGRVDASMQFCFSYFVGLYAHQIFEVSGFSSYSIQGIVFIIAAAYVCSKTTNDNRNSEFIRGSYQASAAR